MNKKFLISFSVALLLILSSCYLPWMNDYGPKFNKDEIWICKELPIYWKYDKEIIGWPVPIAQTGD